MSKKELTPEDALEKYSNADHSTKRFIAVWLNSYVKILCKNPWEQLLEDAKSIDPVFLAECILTLHYSDFLKTPYWTTIAAYVKNRDGYKCKRCSRTAPFILDVHHRAHDHHTAYDHHGLEHRFTDDLITLCRRCHSLRHGHIVDAICAEFEQQIKATKDISEGFLSSVCTNTPSTAFFWKRIGCTDPLENHRRLSEKIDQLERDHAQEKKSGYSW